MAQRNEVSHTSQIFQPTLGDLLQSSDDQSSTINDALIAYLSSHGLVYLPEWGPPERIAALEPVDSDFLSADKEITGSTNLGLLPGDTDTRFHIQLREASVVDLNFRDEQGNLFTTSLILPTFVPIFEIFAELAEHKSLSFEQASMLGAVDIAGTTGLWQAKDADIQSGTAIRNPFIEEITSTNALEEQVDSASGPQEIQEDAGQAQIGSTEIARILSHSFLHRLDNRRGSFQRLATDQTLAEIGIEANDQLVLFNPGDMQSSIVSKLTRLDIWVLNETTNQWLVLPIPHDTSRELCEAWIADRFELPEGISYSLLVDSIPADERNTDATENRFGPSGAPPDLTTTIDVDVYAGPDTQEFPFIGILSVHSTARITGKNQLGTWLQIVFPKDNQGRGWVDTQPLQLTPEDVASIPIVPAPSLWKTGSLFDLNIWQRDAPMLRVVASSLVDHLRRQFGDRWSIEPLPIQVDTGLLVQFVAGDTHSAPVRRVLLRVVEDRWCFQTPLLDDLALSPDIEQQVLFLERLRHEKFPLNSAEIGFDSQQRLVLRMNTTERAFQQLNAFDVDLLQEFYDCANIVRSSLNEQLFET